LTGGATSRARELLALQCAAESQDAAALDTFLIWVKEAREESYMHLNLVFPSRRWWPVIGVIALR
jgi:hypothetical protein